MNPKSISTSERFKEFAEDQIWKECTVNFDSREHYANSKIFQIGCQCLNCKYFSTNFCETTSLPKYILLCGHCMRDLAWHGLIEESCDIRQENLLKNIGDKK